MISLSFSGLFTHAFARRRARQDSTTIRVVLAPEPRRAANRILQQLVVAKARLLCTLSAYVVLCSYGLLSQMQVNPSDLNVSTYSTTH